MRHAAPAINRPNRRLTLLMTCLAGLGWATPAAAQTTESDFAVQLQNGPAAEPASQPATETPPSPPAATEGLMTMPGDRPASSTPALTFSENFPTGSASRFGNPTQFANAAVNPRSLFSNPAAAGALTGLASVPYMIGDTNAGTCFSLRGVVDADIGHPTLTCSRLNISENNAALPTDRFYYSYRHFHNSTQLRVYQFIEEYNIDRHVLGFEKTAADGLVSLEVRLPIVERLRSDVISIVDPERTGIVDLVSDEEREVGLGNVSLIGKTLLLQNRDFVWSAGLGVTLPTAEDVRYRLGNRVSVPNDLVPGLVAINTSVFDLLYENETVYLSPFTAWYWQPNRSRWFHQGFLQVEVAANPSTLNAEVAGFSDFTFNGVDAGFNFFNTPGAGPVEVDVFAQTLMRLNLGVGYELLRPDARRTVSTARALFEMHYTTTVQEANRSLLPLQQFGAGVGTVFPQFAQVGNAENRTDILNAAVGLSAGVGPMYVTNAVVAPLKDGPDRGFDFEYNLQVQWLF